MRVLLQFPPVASVWHLPAGIAQLTAVLEQSGHEVLQRYSHITALEHVLVAKGGEEVKRALNFCDAIVYREGFQPILKIVETLDPSKASGTVWHKHGEVRINPGTQDPTSFEDLPTPVFDKSVRQWSSDRVYSLYTTSNCYHSCGFCAIPAASDTYLSSPRVMSPRRVAHHMQQLGIRRFDITNEMFPSREQIALGQELKRVGHKAEWQCYLTMEPALARPNYCKELYDAGCRAVQLGLESLSINTLKHERKGWNNPDTYAKILRNLREAGIQTHVFLIAGIPGEPLHLGLAWTSFIEEYGEDILTIKASRYRLTRHSPEERNPPSSIEVLPDTRPLHLNRDFRYRDISRKKVEAVRDLLEEACRRHWAYSVTSTLPWWVNRGRFTFDEFREMRKMLPSEPSIPNLRRTITRSEGILKEELERELRVRSYTGVLEATRDLF